MITVDELKNKIASANKAYRSGNPVMSDQAWDDLLESLQKQISEEDFNTFRDSLHEVKGKVKHPFIMGSLDKLKAEEPAEVKKFIKEHCRTLNVSAKVDGISCRLHYENEKLVSASTRGDGTFGEDLTDKIKFVKGIPQTLPGSHIMGDSIDIRGELVILKSDFEKMTGFANGRNAVAGIMGRKDWNPEDIKNVSFIAYTILGNQVPKSAQFKTLDKIWGFKTAWNTEIDNPDDKIVDELFELASQEFDYDTDGLVICDTEYVNEDKYRPDACKAFKINQLTATTKLLDVVFEGPSKNGLHVPVAILEPVELGGAMISRASLYNIDFIDEKGLKYGSTIEIVRSGDVIPKVLKVVKNDASCKDIVLPEVCNCCGSKLVRDGVNLCCKNKKCEDQVVNQLVLFIKNLGVKSASNATLKNFGITSFEELVKFEPNKKYKSELKLAEELNDKMFSRSKLDLLCNMTCFGGLAETTLRKIIDFYASKGSQIENFLFSCDPKGYALNTNMKSLWIERYGLPEGVGELTLDKFQDGLEEAYNNVMLVVDNPKYHWVAALQDNPESARKQSNGQSVCFTGALNTMSRSEASKKAQEAGFEVKSGVSKGLTYLVTNNIDSGSSKAKKAKELGTKVITEEEFLKLLTDNMVEEDIASL